MKIFLLIDDDDDKVVGAYTSKENLNKALNGQMYWTVQEIEADQGQLKITWELVRNNQTNEMVKVGGPYYNFVDEGSVRSKDNNQYTWFVIQAESKEEAIQIAEKSKLTE